MTALAELDWQNISAHYRERLDTHTELLDLHSNKKTAQFVRLALGITKASGNYSADKHALGPQIISQNPDAERRVFDLAQKFIDLKVARRVPELVRSAHLQFLQIGVGSELSCMVNP